MNYYAWRFFFGSLYSTCSKLVLAAVLLGHTAGSLCSEPPVVPLRGTPDSRQPRQLHLPLHPHEYNQPLLPAHVRAAASQFDNTPPDNPITNSGATLGRVLFYDPSLSANSTTSCASCHKQEIGFSDDRRLSVGFAGERVARNSMSLINVRYYPNGKMFWDERAASLEQQVLMPIENEIEMGHKLPALVAQLQADPLYPPLFRHAFGDQQVTQQRIARALAQFVRSIVSFNSKYDQGRAQVASVYEPFPNFTDEENLGKTQFFGRAQCARCHLEAAHESGDSKIALLQKREVPKKSPSPPDAIAPAPLYASDLPAATGGQSAFFYLAAATVNGIDSDEPGVDEGVGQVTKRPEDAGRFKVPSLRNLTQTSPYMHDGRFVTIDQVLEHYNWSVKPHPNLDGRLAEFAANGMALPEREKVALAKFLGTLTDPTVLSDPKFSDPFVRSTESTPPTSE